MSLSSVYVHIKSTVEVFTSGRSSDMGVYNFACQVAQTRINSQFDAHHTPTQHAAASKELAAFMCNVVTTWQPRLNNPFRKHLLAQLEQKLAN